MPGAVRTGTDRIVDHCWICPPPIPPCHTSNYGTGSPNVFVNGDNSIRVGDPVMCGDTAGQGSPNVFVNGIAMHRLGDSTTGSHSCYAVTTAATGSGNVIAN